MEHKTAEPVAVAAVFRFNSQGAMHHAAQFFGHVTRRIHRKLRVGGQQPDFVRCRIGGDRKRAGSQPAFGILVEAVFGQRVGFDGFLKYQFARRGWLCASPLQTRAQHRKKQGGFGLSERYYSGDHNPADKT